MKLTHTEAAIWSVVELALKKSGKTKAADAIRANDERLEATTETHSCALYRMANGTPAFRAKAVGSGSDIQLSGFKLLQKANSVQEKMNGIQGGPAVAGTAPLPRADSTDSAERNRSVGLMRRKSG